MSAPYSSVTLVVHWDADIGTTQDIELAVYVENVATGALGFYEYSDQVSFVMDGRRSKQSCAFSAARSNFGDTKQASPLVRKLHKRLRGCSMVQAVVRSFLLLMLLLL